MLMMIVMMVISVVMIGGGMTLERRTLAMFAQVASGHTSSRCVRGGISGHVVAFE